MLASCFGDENVLRPALADRSRVERFPFRSRRGCEQCELVLLQLSSIVETSCALRGRTYGTIPNRLPDFVPRKDDVRDLDRDVSREMLRTASRGLFWRRDVILEGTGVESERLNQAGWRQMSAVEPRTRSTGTASSRKAIVGNCRTPVDDVFSSELSSDLINGCLDILSEEHPMRKTPWATVAPMSLCDGLCSPFWS